MFSLLQAEPRLLVDERTLRVLGAPRLADLADADRLWLEEALRTGPLTEAELEDRASVEGVAMLLGRRLGRQIGIESTQTFRTAESNEAFISGAFADARRAFRAFALRRRVASRAALDAFLSAVGGEVARVFTHRHNVVLEGYLARHSDNLLRRSALQDALDLCRLAVQAGGSETAKLDGVTIGFQAQVAMLSDVIEALRARAAHKFVESHAGEVESVEALIAAARSSARCRYPFSAEQRNHILRRASVRASAAENASPAPAEETTPRTVERTVTRIR